ncbi:MAG: hypothetical protein ACUVT8_12705 [Armatimonadota bacterium]
MDLCVHGLKRASSMADGGELLRVYNFCKGLFCLWCAVAVLLMVFARIPLSAEGWEWPAEMQLGGFRINDISGAVRPDGSGEATGIVVIPRIPGQRAVLKRLANGEILAEVAMNARISGAQLVGSYVLDMRGLRSRRAEIKLIPHSVVDVDATVDPGGRFVGTGRVKLNQLLIPVKFSIFGDSFVLAGSTKVQSQLDTPLAKYTFSGELKLSTQVPQVLLTASGVVRRIGKLSDQSATVTVSDVGVDAVQGTCVVTIEGVAVAFRLF